MEVSMSPDSILGAKNKPASLIIGVAEASASASVSRMAKTKQLKNFCILLVLPAGGPSPTAAVGGRETRLVRFRFQVKRR